MTHLCVNPRRRGMTAAGSRTALLRATHGGLPREAVRYFFMDQDHVLRSATWQPDGEVTTGGDDD